MAYIDLLLNDFVAYRIDAIDDCACVCLMVCLHMYPFNGWRSFVLVCCLPILPACLFSMCLAVA